MEFLRLTILACSLALYTDAMHTYLAGDVEDIENVAPAPLLREKRAPAVSVLFHRYISV